MQLYRKNQKIHMYIIIIIINVCYLTNFQILIVSLYSWVTLNNEILNYYHI